MSPKCRGCASQSTFMVLQFLIIVMLVGHEYYEFAGGGRRKGDGSTTSSDAARKLRRSAAAALASSVIDVLPPAPVDSLYEPLCQLVLDKLPGHGPSSLVDFSVASAFESRGRRDAIRQGWGKLAVGMGMRVRFFVGSAADGDVHGAASREAEARKFGDLVVLNMTDGYEALTLKTLSMLVYTARCGNGAFVGKVDEDVFVWVARLAKRLSHVEADTSHVDLTASLGVYLGNFWVEMKAIEDRGNKNFEGRYMGKTFPPYAAGPVYFLSRLAVEYLSLNARRLNTVWHNEDMAVGTWLLGADVAYLNDFHIKILGWKHHERPYLAEHATDITPFADTEAWQIGLATNYSTTESQFEAQP